jgi:hypothetical protein
LKLPPAEFSMATMYEPLACFLPGFLQIRVYQLTFLDVLVLLEVKVGAEFLLLKFEDILLLHMVRFLLFF